jgi:hypothetical protein
MIFVYLFSYLTVPYSPFHFHRLDKNHLYAEGTPDRVLGVFRPRPTFDTLLRAEHETKLTSHDLLRDPRMQRLDGPVL